jgi:hypothetical protein
MFEFFKKLFWGNSCENCGNHDEAVITPIEEVPTVTTEEVNISPVVETANEEVINTPVAVEEIKVEETIAAAEPTETVEQIVTTETVETTNTIENNWEIIPEEVKI